MKDQPVLILLPVVWLLFLCTSVTAQVGFSLPVFNNVRSGTFVDAPVTVTDFTRVISIQFVIRWDPKVLRFQEINQPMLQGLDPKDDFGTTMALDSGILRFRWVNLLGPTLPNNAPIFNIRFSVVGSTNSSTALVFTEIRPTTFFEVVLIDERKFTFEQSRAKLRNGSVAIGFALSGREPKAPDHLLKVFPNPFQQYFSIAFDRPISLPAQVRLTDATGKIILVKNLTTDEAQNGMVIENNTSWLSGMYWLYVQTPDFFLTKSLISL